MTTLTALFTFWLALNVIFVVCWISLATVFRRRTATGGAPSPAPPVAPYDQESTEAVVDEVRHVRLAARGEWA